MDLKSKFQIRDDMGGRVINQPGGVDLGFVARPGADYVIVFVQSVREVAQTRDAAIGGLANDGLLWYCYPKKSSGIRTDINRDHGWDALTAKEFRGVRAISIDDTWSGLRFRKQRYIASKK